jgi:alcohol dehydrogenase class IV
VGLPASLAGCGVTIEDLDAVARMSGGSPSISANPRPVSEDDARAILAAAY